MGSTESPNISMKETITPPIQAPYLLKCIPDRVTDDSGAMLSYFIIRMNKNRPQEGRWTFKTVFNHAGKNVSLYASELPEVRGRELRASGRMDVVGEKFIPSSSVQRTSCNWMVTILFD